MLNGKIKKLISIVLSLMILRLFLPCTDEEVEEVINKYLNGEF